MRLASVPNLLRAAVWLLLASALPAQQGAASARAYLYLEPTSARFECLVPLPGMMALLGEPSDAALPPEAQQRLRDAVQSSAPGWLRLKFDGGEPAVAAAFRTTIVKGVPGRTEILQPGETVSAAGAMLGLVWEFDLAAVPERIGITWSGFSEAIPLLTTSIIAGMQSEDCELSAGAPSFEWANRGRLALRAPLAAVPPLPPVRMIRLPMGSIVWVVLGGIFFGFRWWRRRGGRKSRRSRKLPGGPMIAVMSIVFGAAVLSRVAPVQVPLPWVTVAPVSRDEAERILAPLLRNVYRAFDQRQERGIYDVLERSIQGDLLQQIYLQTIGALTLDAQDATRVKLDDSAGLENPAVHVEAVRMKRGARGFVADTEWTVIGNVGHWGHQHQRVNRYLAKVSVDAVPVENPKGRAAAEWKIVGLEVERETRM